MAITAATLTSDFDAKFLPPEIAEPIFEQAARQSVLMSLAQRVELNPNGKAVPVVTGRPSVGWVAEGAKKPATKGALSLKTITPKKMAAIAVMSAETVRANPGKYSDTLKQGMADAFAIAFDMAGFHDEGPDGTAGGGPFSTYLDQSTNAYALGTNNAAAGGLYKDLTAAMATVVTSKDSTNRRRRLTGWAIDGILEPSFWGQVDSNGRPIWVDLPGNQTASAVDAANAIVAGRLMNRPAFIGEGVATDDDVSVVGYGGDWRQAAWGAVGGISFDVSTQATVTINGELVSLWEENLVAIRAEAEYGWLVNDVESFVKLTNTDNSPVTSA